MSTSKKTDEFAGKPKPTPPSKPCDCLNKTEEAVTKKLKEILEEQNPGKPITVDIAETGFDNTALVFSKTGRTVLSFPFTLHYSTEGKKGPVNKKRTTKLFPTYCPFCGTKMDIS